MKTVNELTPETQEVLLALKKAQYAAYFAGVRHGIREYAHWADGEQFVGTCGKPLCKAIDEVDQDEATAFRLLNK
jgi:hypothetical protein